MEAFGRRQKPDRAGPAQAYGLVRSQMSFEPRNLEAGWAKRRQPRRIQVKVNAQKACRAGMQHYAHIQKNPEVDPWYHPHDSVVVIVPACIPSSRHLRYLSGCGGSARCRACAATASCTKARSPSKRHRK